MQIENDPVVIKTAEYVKSTLKEDTTGHGWQHTKRVYDTACHLASLSRKRVDMKTVAYAALLHDIADWKFNNGDQKIGAETAVRWLVSCQVSSERVEAVKTIIENLSFKGQGEKPVPLSPEGQIVQDADRLDGMGAIGIARTFATGAVLKNAVTDFEIPPRVQMSQAEYCDRSVKSTSVNHFFEKLLTLRDMMHTPQARKEAEKRHRFMVEFLSELFEECGATGSIHQKLLGSF